VLLVIKRVRLENAKERVSAQQEARGRAPPARVGSARGCKTLCAPPAPLARWAGPLRGSPACPLACRRCQRARLADARPRVL
jgi:hypothetical protein